MLEMKEVLLQTFKITVKVLNYSKLLSNKLVTQEKLLSEWMLQLQNFIKMENMI